MEGGLEDLLGPLEAAVMEVLWDEESAGEMTVNDMLEVLNADRVEPYAYSTVVTVMARLNKKGVLDRRREGKPHVYWPAMDRQEFVRSRASQAARAMLADFGDLAISGFVDQLEDDQERLAKLEALLEEDNGEDNGQQG